MQALDSREGKRQNLFDHALDWPRLGLARSFYQDEEPASNLEAACREQEQRYA